MSRLKIQAHIEGMDELRKTLLGLPAQIQRRVLRPAMAAEGRRVAKHARSYVPVRHGLLKKSMGSKVKTYVQSGAVVAIVGPRSDFKQVIAGKPVKPSKYAHLVEFGTRAHLIPRRSNVATRKTYGGQMHPGAKAQKPLTRGYKSGLEGAGPRMADRMAVEIEKQAAKGAFRGRT